LRWIKSLLLTILILIVGCDLTVPDATFTNPLDEEQQQENGVEVPALVFFPSEMTVGIGFAANVEVYALDIQNLAGAHVIVKYDQAKLNLVRVTEGDFFESADQTIFQYQDHSSTGILDIYTSYLGGDSVAVEGTGRIATLQFAATLGGESVLTFDPASEFADPDDVPIAINGFGEGVIHAQ